MHKQHARRAITDGASRLYEQSAAQGQNLGPHDTGEDWCIKQADNQDDIGDRLPGGRHDGERQNNGREHAQQIHTAQQRLIDPATAVTGPQANRKPDHNG